MGDSLRRIYPITRSPERSAIDALHHHLVNLGSNLIHIIGVYEFSLLTREVASLQEGILIRVRYSFALLDEKFCIRELNTTAILARKTTLKILQRSLHPPHRREDAALKTLLARLEY